MLTSGVEVLTPLFAAGDVVQLRSGGPLLSVTHCKSTSATVIYYNSVTGLYETFTTNEACLKHANAAPQTASRSRAF